MLLEEVLIGIVSGIFVISLVNPLVSTFGFNKFTYIFLLYLMPLTGVVTVTMLRIFQRKQETTKGMESERVEENLEGKWVVIHTKLGSVHKGRVRRIDNNMIVLDYAVRLDVPDNTVLDHLFLSKEEIKQIEVSNNGEFVRT